MSREIKNIDFNTYYAAIENVLNNVFQNDTYNAALEEVSIESTLINAYAPDFELGEDNETIFNRVYSDEGQEIIRDIRNTEQGDELEVAMRESINYRKRMIVNSPMSMSDYALSKLIDVLAEKVKGIDTSMLNDDTVKLLGEAASKVNEHDFAMKVIDGLGERGYLPKVKNRATRRKKKEE